MGFRLRPGELDILAPDPTGAWLKARDLVRGRRGALRLPATSLNVGPGELRLLVGPNGSGKSTLLRLLAGYDRPDGGTVAWHGVAPPRIATHFGADQLFPQLTVAEHLALLAQSWPEMEADKPARLLDEWHLGGIMTSYPGELSSGERQGAHLACVLSRPSDLLLLDEPERHLDEHVEACLLAELMRPHGARVAVVATHSRLFKDTVPASQQSALGEAHA